MKPRPCNYLKFSLDRSRPLAVQIEENIVRLMADGVLLVTDRLPTIKALAELLAVHHRTVEKAYRQLKQKNLLECRGNKGCFIKMPGSAKQIISPCKPGKVPCSLTVKKIRDFSKHSLSWLEMGMHYPHPGILPNDRFLNVYRSVYASHYSNKHRPCMLSGLDEALLKLLHDRKIFVGMNQFCLVPQRALALQLVCSALALKDHPVLLASPADEQVRNLLLSMGAKLCFSSRDSSQLDLEQLEKICRKQRLSLVVTRPAAGFPVPLALSLEERRELLQLSAKYGFVILEIDEEHELWREQPLKPLITQSAGQHIITISTLTKLYAPLSNYQLVIGSPEFIHNLWMIHKPFYQHRDLVMEKTIARLINEEMLQTDEKKLASFFRERESDLWRLKARYLGDHLDLILPEVGLSAWLSSRKSVVVPDFGPLQKTGISDDPSGAAALYRYDGVRLGFGMQQGEQLETLFRNISVMYQL
ncbi:GntR family transcriptional regulator [Pedobacter sp. SYSU D00535]|uniref:GntR family transcriptional regulator n=1 Tax=Pedobacter sp. SYSU D00535 TaxID=2810308 RepID=UPI001A9794B4|nr:GntR family transcriptional regulator [Pedobacter sp. SYSU D00535]